jgi:hypothetical protein
MDCLQWHRHILKSFCLGEVFWFIDIHQRFPDDLEGHAGLRKESRQPSKSEPVEAIR